MARPTHVHEIPIRWRDLDFLEHVTNVVYVEFATDALAVMAEDGVLGTETSLAAMHVDYLAPVELVHETVRVASTVLDDVIEQKILVAAPGGERVAAKVRAELGPRPPMEHIGGDRGMVTSHVVRPSDIGPDGHVPPSGVFTFFQEARARLQLLAEVPPPSMYAVVVHSACRFGRPLVRTPRPYTVRTWVERVGGSSVAFASELSDEDTVYARGQAVVVGFDRDAQCSRPLTAGERERIEAYAGH